MYIWISSWCAFSLYFLTPQFIVLWIHQEGLLPSYVFIALVINFYIIIFNSIMGIYKDADGIFWEDRYRGIITGVVNLGLNLFFAVFLGKYGDGFVLFGIVMSTTLSILSISIPWSIRVTFKRYFCRSPQKYVLFLVKMSTVFFMILTAGILLSERIGISEGKKGIYNLLFRVLVCLVFPNLIMFIAYRKTEQFKRCRVFIDEYIRSSILKKNQ